MHLIIQCVVNRAYEDMLLVEGLWRCFSVAPGFPDKKYISSSKAVGTWSSKFCRLNNTNSSLVPFIKVYNLG